MYEKKVTVPEKGWNLSDLFHEIQEVSGEAASTWNASGEDLKKFGLMWVVVRYEVELSRKILPGEELCFKTWALPFRHMMSQRNYLLFDGNGELLLSGAGIWAVVDRASRKMIEPSGCPVQFQTEENEVKISRPGQPVRVPIHKGSTYMVQEADLDMNLHMNNTRYLSLAESHVAECLKVKCPRQIRAGFQNEARLGETIQLNWGYQNHIQYMSGMKNGTSCFEVSLLYENDPQEEFAV